MLCLSEENGLWVWVSFIAPAFLLRLDGVTPFAWHKRAAWLRTNGVSTNGAAAKVMIFVRLGEEYALALLGG